jgi:zinc/manganese transport system ATP-binding protein
MTIVFNKGRTTPGHPVGLDRVTFGYSRIPVFTELSLVIPGGAASAVVGPNGSGKSTLLGLIAGVNRPTRGTVDLGGADEVALSVQLSRMPEAFPITVAETVAMGRWRRLGLLRRPTREDRAIVAKWITELGLDELRQRRLGELSGGQRQRALLAQAFAQQAPIMALDEPTNGLDADTAARVGGHLRRLADSGTTVVVATHDMDIARGFDFCVRLGGGPVECGAPADVLQASPNG